MFDLIQIVLVYEYALITWDRPQLQIDIKEINSLLLELVTQISLYCVFVIVWDLLVLATSSWTHWRRVTHICVGNLTTIGSDNGLSPGRHHRHYLKQCWYIVNSNQRNKRQWNLIRNLSIFIQKSAFKNVILSRPQCVKILLFHWQWDSYSSASNGISPNEATQYDFRFHLIQLGPLI